jgi:hypothetical protein
VRSARQAARASLAGRFALVLHAVPDAESALYVPLRSNAKSLVTGAPIAALRRRLKYGSLFHDTLILEAGILRMNAGAGGSFSSIDPPTQHEPPRWETPRQRHQAEQSPFQISVGRETTPGVPTAAMQPLLASDSAISWTATLLPFADELPAAADWIHFGRFTKPGPSVEKAAQRWIWADQRNARLERAIPGRFVRDAVIKNADNDLAVATAAECTMTMDGLHSQVIARRFGDEQGWQLRGYSIPILFPQIGDWTWQDIADLRRDSNMARFRAVMREVETAAADEAAGGDLEAAAHHAYERHLADAVPALARISWVAKNTTVGFVIGGIAGFLTMGITGPGGPLAGAALGVVPGAAAGVRDVLRQRKARGWVAVGNRISGNRQA